MSPVDLTDSIKNLPTVLYRGDQAKRVCRANGQSLMVDQYQSQGLFTNLLCGGNPLAVTRAGIRSTVCQHINGWPQSHYLSFSSDIRVAEIFASGVTSRQLVPTNQKNWDAVIFSFDTSQITWTIKGIGVFFGTAPFSGQPYFGGYTRLALIDNVTLLKSLVAAGQNQYLGELMLAQGDQEWLVIPLDPMPPGQLSHIGYSAQMQSHLVSGDHFDLV